MSQRLKTGHPKEKFDVAKVYNDKPWEIPQHKIIVYSQILQLQNFFVSITTHLLELLTE